MSTDIASAPPGPTIKDRLNDPRTLAEIAKVLPRHCSPDRMARVALTALLRTPKLSQCDQASFFKALLDLSQWGLEPDGRRAHLIPFENRRRGVVEVQLILDYKGLVELAYRSGVVKNIHADVVREGDLFEYSTGRIVRHVPHFLRRDSDKPDQPGDVFAAYCVIELEGDTVKTEVLSKAEVEGIRKRSKAGNNGPWVTDWCEMAKKTAFRRATKWIPLSAELRDAFDRDDDVIEAPAAAPRMSTPSDLGAFLTGAGDDEGVIDGDGYEADQTPPDVDSDLLADLDSALREAETVTDTEAIKSSWLGKCQTPDDETAVRGKCEARAKQIRDAKGRK